jgi:hypothetical protein
MLQSRSSRLFAAFSGLGIGIAISRVDIGSKDIYPIRRSKIDNGYEEI